MKITEDSYKIDLIFRLFESEISSINKFDQITLVLSGPTQKEAYQNALIAASKELELRNRKHLLWEFVGLENFELLNSNQQECEQAYILKNPEDAYKYIQQLRFKNNTIQQEISRSL